MTSIILTAVSQRLRNKTEILKGSFQSFCVSPKVIAPINKYVFLIFQTIHLTKYISHLNFHWNFYEK